MKKYSILLVEDDKCLSSVLKQVLERQNLLVDIADQGFVALEMLNNKKYDGVLSDICMPECDGLTFIKKLRQQRNFTPVLFYSGHAGAEEAKVVQSFGAEGIVSKQNVRLVGSRLTEIIQSFQKNHIQNHEEAGNSLMKEFEDMIYNC